MKRGIDNNERIFTESLPKITKLEDEQRKQELQAVRESVRMDCLTSIKEQQKMKQKKALTIACKEEQLKTMKEQKFSMRARDIRDVKPENLSLHWNNMGAKTFRQSIQH